jgi:hypothetical protein
MMKRRFAATNFLVKGISRLSELQIDADKDWNEKAIANLKELAQGMQKGDIIYRSSAGLVKLSPGPIGHELTSSGEDNPIEWRPPPSP